MEQETFVEMYMTELSDLVFIQRVEFNGNSVYTVAASITSINSSNFYDDVETAFDPIAWDENSDKFTRYGIKETDALVRNFIPNAGNPLIEVKLKDNKPDLRTIKVKQSQWFSYVNAVRNV